MRITTKMETDVYFDRQEVNEILRVEAERRIEKATQQVSIVDPKDGVGPKDLPIESLHYMCLAIAVFADDSEVSGVTMTFKGVEEKCER